MAAHTFSLQEPWFKYVKNGDKIYEGRRWTAKVAAIQPGDRIVFTLSEPVGPVGGETVEKVVDEVFRFGTFEDALQTLPLEQVLPGVATVEDGVQIYLKYVSIETQYIDGVAMIKLC